MDWKKEIIELAKDFYIPMDIVVGIIGRTERMVQDQNNRYNAAWRELFKYMWGIGVCGAYTKMEMQHVEST